MTIETLIAAIPPPAEPAGVFLGPWEPVEAEIGTALPRDYKDLVRVYGSGYYMEFFGIDVPRCPNLNIRLEHQVRLVSETFLYGDDVSYPLWPAPGGLLSFGGTDNGDSLFWLTRGAPADWGVVVWDRADLDFELFDCGLTSFLAGLATGEILPKAFPEDLLPSDCLFKPTPAGALAWPPE
ncbi:MAG: hypothetical protein JWR47_274 [Phenylobacterium sp.]|nr:hypothetical protein [Phenylobacterium sp.]